MSVRVRLALPPHGTLTLADAHAALCNWLFARKRAGRFLLRVEHAGRAAPAEEARALDDLRWLGLRWDEEIVRQSERLDRYRAAAERLVERGAAYLCFCVPAAPASHDGGGPAGRAPGCDGRCRALPRSEGERRRAAGERASVRLAVSAHALTVRDTVRGTLEFAGAEAGDPLHLRRAPAPRLAGLLGAPADETTLRVLEVVRRDAGSRAEVRARLDAVVEPIPVPASRAARPLLEAVLAALPAAIGSEEEAEALLAGVAGGARGGRRAVAQAVRAALTGESHGPAAGALLWALGAGESRRRIEQALAGVTAG